MKTGLNQSHNGPRVVFKWEFMILEVSHLGSHGQKGRNDLIS